MGLQKLERPMKFDFFGKGFVKLFDDLSIEFTGRMMEDIKEKYNQGYSFEEIADYTNRDPDEIFLALFHLARTEGDIRPAGKRLK